MKPLVLAAVLTTAAVSGAAAHDIVSGADTTKSPAFDITMATASTDGRLATFAMEVAGIAGSEKPVPIGKLTGAKVEAYVWPTNLDPGRSVSIRSQGSWRWRSPPIPISTTRRFTTKTAMATRLTMVPIGIPLVVLVEAEACGAGLKVRDVSPGVDLLPATAPYFPIALDSPGMSPILDGRIARITVPVAEAGGSSFDAVTAELQVNETGEVPLLCVTGVHDVASGDLSLPGRVMLEDLDGGTNSECRTGLDGPGRPPFVRRSSFCEGMHRPQAI